MKENLWRLAFAVLCLLSAAVFVPDAFGQTVMVNPGRCVAPCEVRMEVRIVQDKANRWWSLAWTNTDGGEGGASGGSLEGENADGIFPTCTKSNPRPCYRFLRGSGTWLVVGCVHRIVGNGLKAFCTEKEVLVIEEEVWIPPISATSAKHRTSLTGTDVRASVGSRTIVFGTATSVRSADNSSSARRSGR